jgi:hypothetical protein
MKSYDQDVEDAAYSFLTNHEYEVKEALQGGTDFHDLMEELDEDWFGEVRDTGFSPRDAVVVLEESRSDPECCTDGMDWQDLLSAMANDVWTQDVWCQCDRMYEDLQSAYDDRLGDLLEESDALKQAKADEDDDAYDEIEDELKQQAAVDIFQEFDRAHTVQPVAEGSAEERDLIRTWFRLGENAGWWHGYPVGGSYLDSRCGSGHGIPEIKTYVDFDHELADKCPWLEGKYKQDVQARLAELESQHSRKGATA